MQDMKNISNSDLYEGFKPSRGNVVRHFKGKWYLVLIEEGYYSENEEPIIVYKALYGDKQVWVRPKDMFNSKTDKEKYPNATQEFRFMSVEKLSKTMTYDEFKNIVVEELKSELNQSDIQEILALF